jgi:hypothetical protein
MSSGETTQSQQQQQQSGERWVWTMFSVLFWTCYSKHKELPIEALV